MRFDQGLHLASMDAADGSGRPRRHWQRRQSPNSTGYHAGQPLEGSRDTRQGLPGHAPAGPARVHVAPHAWRGGRGALVAARAPGPAAGADQASGPHLGCLELGAPVGEDGATPRPPWGAMVLTSTIRANLQSGGLGWDVGIVGAVLRHARLRGFTKGISAGLGVRPTGARTSRLAPPAFLRQLALALLPKALAPLRWHRWGRRLPRQGLGAGGSRGEAVALQLQVWAASVFFRIETVLEDAGSGMKWLSHAFPFNLAMLNHFLYTPRKGQA